VRVRNSKQPLYNLCALGPDVIRKEAWSFYRTISGVRLCWELEEPKGPNGSEAFINTSMAVVQARNLLHPHRGYSLLARGSYSTPSRSWVPTYALQGYLAHKKPPNPLGPP